MSKILCAVLLSIVTSIPLTVRAGEPVAPRPAADDPDRAKKADDDRRALEARRDLETKQRKLFDEFQATEARMKAVEDARTLEQGATNRQKLDAERAQLIETLKQQHDKLQELKKQLELGPTATQALVAETWRNEINKALDRKVSFEFVDTSLTDACEFIRQIAKVNLIIDPKSLENGTPVINLRVTDMKLLDALSWVCKLAGQRPEFRNQSIFITADQEGAPKADPKRDVPPLTASGKLRVKLTNGNELEADSSVFVNHPELVAGIVEQVLGVTDRRIVGLPLAKDNPARQPLLQLLSAHARNDVKIEYHEELNLLLISGKNSSAVNELYKLASLGLDAHRQFTPREKPVMQFLPTPATKPSGTPKAPPKEAQF
jgi:hypothetical protein